jgi:hypothetical protein
MIRAVREREASMSVMHAEAIMWLKTVNFKAIVDIVLL